MATNSHQTSHDNHPTTTDQEPLKQTTISCDSCLRNNVPCIGFPCERCTLNDFECLYSPPEARIQELRQQFQSLLPPGHVFPVPDITEVSPYYDTQVKGEDDGKEEKEKEFGCVACGYLSKKCSRERPKCSECHEEGLLCVYGDSTKSFYVPTRFKGSEKVGRGGVSALAEQLKRDDLVREAKECDTCKVWTAYCDGERPSCSSCVVRGVDCKYSLSRRKKATPPTSKVPSSAGSLKDLRRRNLSTSPPTRPLPLPPGHQSTSHRKRSPPLYASLFQPPISQMYSTPSGCIACFNSKQKCVPRPTSPLPSTSPHFPTHSKTCQRCSSLGQECKAFPPGTKLIACNTCIDSQRPCTNVREGLRCDECVSRNVPCSRVESEAHLAVTDSEINKSDEKNGRISKDSRKDSEQEGRTCELCQKLELFCDGLEPSCALCTESGLSCLYPGLTEVEIEEEDVLVPVVRPTMDRVNQTARRMNDEGLETRRSCSVCGFSVKAGVDGRQGPCGICGLVEKQEEHGESSGTSRVPQKAEADLEKVTSTVNGKGKDKVLLDSNQEDTDAMDEEDWEEISRDEAFGIMKDGELGVMELD